MPAFVDLEHPSVVNTVSEAALVGTEDLPHLQDYSQFVIIEGVEMRLQQRL